MLTTIPFVIDVFVILLLLLLLLLLLCLLLLLFCVSLSVHGSGEPDSISAESLVTSGRTSG